MKTVLFVIVTFACLVSVEFFMFPRDIASKKDNFFVIFLFYYRPVLVKASHFCPASCVAIMLIKMPKVNFYY